MTSHIQQFIGLFLGFNESNNIFNIGCIMLRTLKLRATILLRKNQILLCYKIWEECKTEDTRMQLTIVTSMARSGNPLHLQQQISIRYTAILSRTVRKSAGAEVSLSSRAFFLIADTLICRGADCQDSIFASSAISLTLPLTHDV